MIFWFISLIIEIEGFNPKRLGCMGFKGELILKRYLIFQYQHLQIYLLQVLVTSGTGSQQMVFYLVKIADTFVFEAC